MKIDAKQYRFYHFAYYVLHDYGIDSRMYNSLLLSLLLCQVTADTT